MTRMLLLFVCLLEFFLLAAAQTALAAGSEPPPKAVQGLLDASGWNTAQDGVLQLNGEWAFYNSQLLEPHDINGAGAAGDEIDYYPVPAAWNKATANGLKLPDQGYATYRLMVKLSVADASRQMGLYMPSVATSYKLWINGKPSAENGVVGTGPERMVPQITARS